MKKISLFIIGAIFLAISSTAYAAKNETVTQGTGSQTDSNQIQNQNQVQTQNQGEDSQLQINAQEQEFQEDNQLQDISKNEAPRSEVATENMSAVSQKVEELLTTEGAQGGIGQQVKQIAQEQKTAQQEIQTELAKVDNRKGLTKFLIGPDYKALKNMQKTMEQNQLRVKQLVQLQNQLINQGNITMVQETIQVLTDQNTVLQDRINIEEKQGSLFGWLFKLFSK